MLSKKWISSLLITQNYKIKPLNFRGFFVFIIVDFEIFAKLFTYSLSFRRRRNLRDMLDKDWTIVAELLAKISPSSK